MLTAEHLRLVRELINAATAGVWRKGQPAGTVITDGDTGNPEADDFYGGKVIGESMREADRLLVIAAKPWLAKLTGEVTRLCTVLDERAAERVALVQALDGLYKATEGTPVRDHGATAAARGALTSMESIARQYLDDRAALEAAVKMLAAKVTDGARRECKPGVKFGVSLSDTELALLDKATAVIEPEAGADAGAAS